LYNLLQLILPKFYYTSSTGESLFQTKASKLFTSLIFNKDNKIILTPTPLKPVLTTQNEAIQYFV